MQNFSILIFDLWFEVQQRLILYLYWNLTVVPNLKHQLLLAIMDLIVLLESDLDSSLAVIIGSNGL